MLWKGCSEEIWKFTEKTLCKGLFLNKVAGLHPKTFFQKNAPVHVFYCKLCHIFCSCKTRSSGCFCKISSCFSHQPQPQNVTIDLVFSFFLFWFISLKHPFGHVLQRGPLKSFGKLTRKHVCQSFFLDKVAHHAACNFIKKGFQHRCFTVNFAKLLKTLWRTPPVSASNFNSTLLTLRPRKTYIYIFSALLF